MSTSQIQHDLGIYILSPIIGVSLLCLFAGVIISMRQNRKLASQRAVYYSGSQLAMGTPVVSQPPVEALFRDTRPAVNTIAADPAELALIQVLQKCLPPEVTAVSGLRAGDLLRWEGGNAPSLSLPRERIDCVLYNTGTGNPCGLILITDTRTIDPLLTSALAATGLPVLHLEARRTWTPDHLAYMLKEGIGIGPAYAV